MSGEETRHLVVGRLRKPHGLKGDCAVFPLTGDPELAFASGATVWLKDLAPSADLRKWFGHDPKKWDEFRRRYARELEPHAAALEQLVERARAGRVTLVFGAKDTEHNNAVALKEHLERRLDR